MLRQEREVKDSRLDDATIAIASLSWLKVLRKALSLAKLRRDKGLGCADIIMRR